MLPDQQFLLHMEYFK